MNSTEARALLIMLALALLTTAIVVYVERRPNLGPPPKYVREAFDEGGDDA